RAAVSDSKVYVVWDDDMATNEVFFRRSTDNGATWKPIVNLSNNEDAHSSGPQIAVAGSKVFVAWIDQSDGPRDLIFRRSTDNGGSWKSPINLSNNNPHLCPFCGADDPDFAVSGSNVYLVWFHQESGPLEIFLRRSTDSGATWKSLVNLSKNTGDSLNPQVAVFGSNVFVVWNDVTPGNLEILLKRSNDGGATWKSTKNLSNNDGASGSPQVAI
ncbi:MAG TPA: sialidase family protein, partial [Nitrososphaera sp.]|nr:sialidase family protein [Nitrososphaera sp.]